MKTKSKTVRILLVDDHEVVRSGLKMLLANQPGYSIVGEAASGQETINETRQLLPDLVILDITLPDISGIETSIRIKNEFPDIHVLALTIHEDEQYFFEMLKAGASGYVPKRAAPEDLVDAIETVMSGHIYVYPGLMKILVSDYLKRKQESSDKTPIPILTPRENEILGFLAEGKTNQEISDTLSISKHTVARHRENLMQKLDLHSRSELVKYAIRKGLIRI